MNKRNNSENRELKTDGERRMMELKTQHPGEWILILKDGSYIHAQKLKDTYVQVPDISKIKTTLRPYKPQELLLYRNR